MSTIAFVFPGQGSQYVGMGKDLHEQSPSAKELFSRADAILNIPLSRLCFDGPEEELRQTKNTQPAIFLQSVILAKSYSGPQAGMAAGHSLGEYSALVYAGALTFEDGIRLVRLRGELMQQAGLDRPGTMAAVIGLDPGTVVEVCEKASEVGIVQAANFNSPGQIVISGSVPGVRQAMELARERGAKLVKELPVSGAFHSPLMESAQKGLQEALENTPVRDASIPVYANVTAQPVRDAGDIRRLLLQQLTSPVRWEESMVAMAADGATTFVEIGPGKVLQGLAKRTLPNITLQGIDRYSDLP